MDFPDDDRGADGYLFRLVQQVREAQEGPQQIGFRMGEGDALTRAASVSDGRRYLRRELAEQIPVQFERNGQKRLFRRRIEDVERARHVHAGDQVLVFSIAVFLRSDHRAFGALNHNGDVRLAETAGRAVDILLAEKRQSLDGGIKCSGFGQAPQHRFLELGVDSFQFSLLGRGHGESP